MKKFQIVNGFCYKDITGMAKKVNLSDFPALVWIEAPDYVFEGWGYDPTKEESERFLKPVPPEGWLYDDGTGAFYEDGQIAPSKRPSAIQQQLSTLEESKADKAEVQAVWDQMATAYSEGVQQA